MQYIHIRRRLRTFLGSLGISCCSYWKTSSHQVRNRNTSSCSLGQWRRRNFHCIYHDTNHLIDISSKLLSQSVSTMAHEPIWVDGQTYLHQSCLC
jgi:hypothetical protein